MNTSALLKIPAFPPVAAKLLRVAADDNTGAKDLISLLRSDPALSAEIIRHANSPQFTFTSEVTTLDQAVVLLGVQRIRALALAAIGRTYVQAVSMVEELRTFWRYNLACALVAEKLAPATRIAPDTAYCAALLHDIGRLGLMVAHPYEYVDLLKTLAAKSASGAELDVLVEERTRFGLDRYEAGEWLARTWNLPLEFRSAAAKYPADAATGELKLVGLVLTACRLANSVGFTMLADSAAPSYSDLRAKLSEKLAAQLPAESAELRTWIETEIAALDSGNADPDAESADRTVREIRAKLRGVEDDLLETDAPDPVYPDAPPARPHQRRRRIWPALVAAAAVFAIVLVYLAKMA